MSAAEKLDRVNMQEILVLEVLTILQGLKNDI